MRAYYTPLYDVLQVFYITLCDNIIMELAKKIGNNLKQARKDKGLTQKEVAEKMKMTQQQYSRFENGVFELNYGQILYLCELYEITPSELFDMK